MNKISLALVSLSVLFISCNKIGSFKMPTSSMEPTIKTGEIVKVDYSAYKVRNPERCDIVLHAFFETTLEKETACGGNIEH